MTTLEFLPYPLTFGMLLLALSLYWVRRRGLVFRLAAAMFGIYILAAVSIVFFPVHIPQNWPTGADFGVNPNSINLIPFNYGRMLADVHAGAAPPGSLVREIIRNVLLTIPFGFGVGFLARLRGRQIFWLALADGLALEGAQFALILIGLGEHSVDINDVILNAAGVLTGYGGYRVWLWMIRRLSLRSRT